jgi:hypothetical protein
MSEVSVLEMPKELNVIWSPQPKQAVFMSRPEFEALYGGAAGGGKSDAILMEVLRQVDKKKYKALILRKTYPQLQELIDRSLELYPKIYPRARYNHSKAWWTFPSGAKVIFGSMQHAKDKVKYQGHQYPVVIFDELTHFQYEEYIFMLSRCRSKDGSIRCYVRATANPGGKRKKTANPVVEYKQRGLIICQQFIFSKTRSMKRYTSVLLLGT